MIYVKKIFFPSNDKILIIKDTFQEHFIKPDGWLIEPWAIKQTTDNWAFRKGLFHWKNLCITIFFDNF